VVVAVGGVVVAGGVPGLTVVIAAVAVAVVVAILVGGDCCSWLRVTMLERFVFAGGSSWGSPL
jgi:predicted branched-subunit amino acid permease